MTTYSYSKLNPEKNEIRLLVLEPARKGKWDDKLRCHLVSQFLTPGGLIVTPYEAISYCWGDPEPTSSILIDGCTLGITDILDSFLRRKRVRASKQRLWIDAVCIYSYRTATKCCRNLRFRPQFCEGSDSNPQKPVLALGALWVSAAVANCTPPTHFS